MTGRLQELVDRAARRGGPGAVLAVDAPRLGLRARLAGGRITADAPIRIASVSKMVTAAAVLRLAEEGRLDIDEPLAGPWEVTLREALAHRAGLPDVFGRLLEIERAGGGKRGGPWDPARMLDLVADDPRPARGAFRYSDTGYVLAGLAIERAAGAPLHDACRALVLDPLGMDATYLEGREPSRGAPATPWAPDMDPGAIDPTIDWGGGGLVSTAGDLVRLVRGLHAGRVVGPAALRQMGALAPAGDGAFARVEEYGLGLARWRASGEAVIGHGGVWGAFAYLWPRADAVVAGSVNRMGAFGGAATELLDGVLAVLAGDRLAG
jgi:D-alanyl-D-alanine carboxypeptidase